MKTRHPSIERLRSLTPFARCTPRELAEVDRLLTPLHAPAGTVMAAEGHHGHEFVVIETGRAQVLVRGHVVAELGTGEFFGELSLFDHGTRTATVIALTDVEALVASHAEFEQMIDVAPSVARGLLPAMAARLREADRRLVG